MVPVQRQAAASAEKAHGSGLLCCTAENAEGKDLTERFKMLYT